MCAWGGVFLFVVSGCGRIGYDSLHRDAATGDFGPDAVVDAGEDIFVTPDMFTVDDTGVAGDMDASGDMGPSEDMGTDAGADATVVIDPSYVHVVPTAGLVTTEAGGSASFSVVLLSAPSAEVEIGFASLSSEVTISTPILRFTPGNWSVPQNITVTGVDDDVADGDQAFTIFVAPCVGAIEYDGLDPADVSGTNLDDDSAGIVVTPLSGLSTSEAGGTASFMVRLGTPPDGSGARLVVASNDTSEGTVDTDTLFYTNFDYDMPQVVTVTGVDDAIEDGDIAYAIDVYVDTTYDSTYTSVSGRSVAVTNVDNDMAAIMLSTPGLLTTTEAGGSATFTVVLSTPPLASVRVAFASSDLTEGAVIPGAVTFTTSNWNLPRTVTLLGLQDLIFDGDIPYSITSTVTSLDPYYSGMPVPAVSCITTDDEVAEVHASTPSVLLTEAGLSAAIDFALSGAPLADVTVSVSSSDLGEATVVPTSLVFTPEDWAEPHRVVVTGVADGVIDGHQAGNIVTSATSSASSAWNGVAVDDVGFSNVDVDDHFLVSGDARYFPRQGALTTGLASKSFVSADGRYVAFVGWSTAITTVSSVYGHVVRHDRTTNSNVLVSISSTGAAAALGATTPSMSSDGRFVCFGSGSADLIADDTNGAGDVFLRDIALGTTERISVGAGGAQLPNGGGSCDVSDDGRYVVFATMDPLIAADMEPLSSDVYVRDRMAGTVELVSQRTGGAHVPRDSLDSVISSSGRYVAFVTDGAYVASDTNSTYDVYLRDRVAATTTLVSVNSMGTNGGNGASLRFAMSSDGRYIAFASDATDLVAGDTNGVPDIYVRDTVLAVTTRVSLSDTGVESNSASYQPSISDGGNRVSFHSDATNLVATALPGGGFMNAFVHDSALNHTYWVSTNATAVVPDGTTNLNEPACLSGDGNTVVFYSETTNLTPFGADAFGNLFARGVP